MRYRILIIALTLVLSLTISLLWVFGAHFSLVTAAPEAELHVCPSGCPYDSVQEAVDAASDGDVIKVAEGTYTGVSEREGVTQMVYLSKTLTIQGGYIPSNWATPDPEANITTLDAQDLGRVLFLKGGITPTIAGLHITGGNALGLGPDQEGGGIYTYNEAYLEVYVTILKDNHIYGNTAWNGGGAYLDGHTGYILNGNTFDSNTASDRGGGMVVFNNYITLTNNLFADNNGGSMGGGLAVLYSDALLQGNTFTDNSAGQAGGGLYVYNSAFESEADVIMKNSAGRGGGLAIFGTLYSQTWRDNWMTNTVVAYNECTVEGSGIYIGGSPLHLWHTTLVDNTGGDDSGILIGGWNPWDVPETSEVDLRDTIVATQTVGIQVEDGSTVDIDSILWYADAITLTQVPEADVSLVNQIMGDPVFSDPALGNFHIGASSAARDTGMASGTPTDLDGLVRPMGFGYDLGAYEYEDAALSLFKTPSLSGANVGKELIYTIVLTSSGTQDTNYVVLTDTLDSLQRATLVESPDGNCTIDDPGWGGRVVCAPGDLNIGDVINVLVTVEVDGSAPLGQALTNTVTARADKAANSTQAVVYAQDCHVRIGDNPKEYTSVQAAVDAAYPTALVKVAGTCMGVYGREGWHQQVFLDRLLTLQGGYSTSNWTVPDPEANITTLDARGLGRVLFVNTRELGAVIDGFYITGGNAYGQVGGHSPIQKEQSSGGGVYIFGSDPTLSNNHIFGNTSAQGGGMYTSFCNLILRGNTFTANSTIGDGGGLLVHAGGAMLSDNLFDSNSAQNGGGFATSYGGGNFTRDTFTGNHASGFGGGLALETTAFLNETLILSNTAEYGGGVSFFEGINNNSPYAILTNTVIADNQASLEGAGVFIPSGGAVHLLHTTLARNLGGDGGGITLGWYDWQSPGASTVIMTNTILAFQDVGIRVTDASTVTVNSVLWYADPIKVSQSVSATVWVQNEHNGDPAFLDPDNGDYHIGETSAARDAGIDSGVTWDLDGELRPMGLGYDLGADEFPAPALSASNQPSAMSVNRGQVMTYALGVTNIGAGSAPATGVVLTDNLDSWQRATGASASAGSCNITNPGWEGTVVCEVGALSTGASATVVLSVEVSASVPLEQAMVNTVVAASNETLNSTAQATTYAQDCTVRINNDPTTYTSVQTAVDAAISGDVVKVAGTCIGAGERAGLRQQVYLDKSLTVRGGYTTTNWTTPDPQANPTTLDALGAGRVFYITGEIDPVIEGLRITGGDAAGLGGVPWGWDAGGGVYVVTATATISNNWLYDNIAGGEFAQGGGVYLQSSASTVFSNTIFGNTAGWGGGIHELFSSATLSHNTILSNTVSHEGGGVCLWDGVTVLTGNTISGNSAHTCGGGILVGSPGSTLINNIVTDNSADVSGSGLCIDRSAQFWHTTVAGNTGGDGSGIYVTGAQGPSSVAFTNTILAQHSVGISVTGGNNVTVNGILWYATPITVSQSVTATVDVQNQHTGDPAFLNPAGGDYHIGAASAARDAGVDGGVTTDIDGQTRPIGLGYDLGADEFFEWFMRYLPLVLRH